MHMLRFGRTFFVLLTMIGFAAATVAFAGDAKSSDADNTRAQITAMLTNFLSPAVMSTAAGHDRFWADDLVYTSSAGKVMHKTDIMKSFADVPKPDAGRSASGKSGEPEPVFTAEDILVRPYGEMAALTFRLVETDPDGKVSYFRNSETFLRRDGKWQAVTWQATRVADLGK
ncbi:MAG: nuclear transport factor 2 family protein [Lysobacteraceae bacterium]